MSTIEDQISEIERLVESSSSLVKTARHLESKRAKRDDARRRAVQFWNDPAVILPLLVNIDIGDIESFRGGRDGTEVVFKTVVDAKKARRNICLHRIKWDDVISGTLLVMVFFSAMCIIIF